MSGHDEGNFTPPFMVCFCEETQCPHWDGLHCKIGRVEDECIDEYYEVVEDATDKS